MPSCKDALGGLVSALLGLVGAGCAGQALCPAESVPRPVARGEPPIPAARAAAASVAAAQAPAPPPEIVPAGVVAPAPQESKPVLPALPPAPLPSEPPSLSLPPPQNAPAKLRELYQLAAEGYAGIGSYIVRLRRREQINGKDKPEEILLVRFREQPWSVYFKWLGTEANGREVVFVKGQHDNQLHTLLAAGDMPFMPAGKRISLAPDNPFVRSSSRHAITEAGFGNMIEGFGRLVQAAEKQADRAGTLTYLGRVKRPEFEAPVDMVEQRILPGADAQMRRGGRRLWAFDPASHLPVLILTCDETGHEVEYYCYDRLMTPVKLDDDDFNPDKLWPQQR